jgi:hypothetical protein
MSEVQQLRSTCLITALSMAGGDLDKAIVIAEKMVSYIVSGATGEQGNALDTSVAASVKG